MQGNKKIELANFNCTFGDSYEPMLQYFSKIVYPSFNDISLIREFKIDDNSSNKYYFTEMEIVSSEKLGYILKGCIVKETIYRGKSKVDKNKKIIEIDANIENGYEHAPYSIFGIILKNHRLFFIKNEVASPNLVTFKATTKYCFEKYIEKINEEIRKSIKKTLFEEHHINPLYSDLKYLPDFKLTITPFIEESSIQSTFDEIVEIDEVSIKFMPQNGDPNFDSVLDHLYQTRDLTESEEVDTIYKKPKNKENIRSLIQVGNGIINFFLKGKNKDNKEISLSNRPNNDEQKSGEIYSSEKIKISLEENLNPTDVTKKILKKVDTSEIALTELEGNLYLENESTFKAILEEKNNERERGSE